MIDALSIPGKDLIQYLGIPFAALPYANHPILFCIAVDISSSLSIELANVASLPQPPLQFD